MQHSMIDMLRLCRRHQTTQLCLNSFELFISYPFDRSLISTNAEKILLYEACSLFRYRVSWGILEAQGITGSTSTCRVDDLS